jgi:Uma2 family endonuclease
MTTGVPGQKTVVYPETDGMPLPDGEYQAPLYREIVGAVQTFFSDRPDVHVNGNTMFYYEEGNPRRVVSPDCYVAFGVDVEAIFRNNTYLLWEMGKPPDFVLEIGSRSTARVDLGSKRDLYARLGIGEYWRFDGTGGDFYREPLVGEYLDNGEYRRFDLHQEADGMVWAHSPTLNLDLCWVDGRLRYYNPATGTFLLNQQEEHSAVEAERASRQAAEARVAELEAELQRIRGEST